MEMNGKLLSGPIEAFTNHLLHMFFSLTNSPATFQTMMDRIFEDLISEGVIVVYLDDILIFTKTLEEHQKVVHQVIVYISPHQR